MPTVFMSLRGVAVNDPGTLKDMVKRLAPHKMDGEIETALQRFKLGATTSNEFWARMDVENWERAETDLMANFRTNPDLSEIVGYLKRKNYKVVLLADMPSAWVDIIISHNRLKHYFDGSYSTADLKASRRQAAAYQKLAEKYGDSVVVDNDESNLLAASRVGMHTILIGKSEGVYKPDYQVSSLREVKEVL